MRFAQLISCLAALLSFVSAATISGSAEVPTECKTCPYTLCPNKKAYDHSTTNFTLSCWTEGTKILGDATWLKTQDGCYVTQYDLVEYTGDYTKDLPYCGSIRPKWTTTTTKTRYMTDCFTAPRLSTLALEPGARAVKHYPYGMDLELLCTARNESEILGRKTWFKTPSNCYVHETTLRGVDDADELDECGPVPYGLNPDDHKNETASKVLAQVGKPAWVRGQKREERSRSEKRVEFGKRWLYNTSIGEEYVNCMEHASVHKEKAGRVERVYQFGWDVVPQCATWGDSDPVNTTRTIFLFTTDFCYIKDNETDPGLTEDYTRGYYYPACDEFVDTIS